MSRPLAKSFLATPHVVVALLVVVNVAAYLLCLRVGGALVIPTPVLAAAGALTPASLQPGEQSRLIAAGFLHADLTHLLTNLLSLLIVGPFLERRLGGTAFSLVYVASLIGAGITSLLLHSGPFLGVGASGAVFGVMGALFALWALGAEELSPGFFLINFGLSAAFASRDPRIDWAAHIGGFVTGMIAVALLDMTSRANVHWLRCKFPEFIKANVLALLVAGGTALWWRPLALLPSFDVRYVVAGCIAAAVLVSVKLLDLLLSAKRGLVGVVIVLAGCNAAAAWVASSLVQPSLAQICNVARALGSLDGAARLLCPNLAWSPAAAAALVAALTLLVFARPLRRGVGDVGFVGATFVGDRRRERGLVRPTRHTRA